MPADPKDGDNKGKRRQGDPGPGPSGGGGGVPPGAGGAGAAAAIIGAALLIDAKRITGTYLLISVLVAACQDVYKLIES